MQGTQSKKVDVLGANQLKVLFRRPPLGTFPLRCQFRVGNFKTESAAVFRTATESLKIVNSALNEVKKVSLKPFEDGNLQVLFVGKHLDTLKGALFFFSNAQLILFFQVKLILNATPRLVKSSCFVHKNGLNNRHEAILTPVEKVEDNVVTCANISLPSNNYEVGVIYGEEKESLKTCVKSANVDYSSKLPLKIGKFDKFCSVARIRHNSIIFQLRRLSEAVE